MDTILTWIYVIVAVLLLFGAAIFVHEWGHYIVALKRGLKVEEFAIGMGPKLYSWKRGDVLWSIRAIPAGGFVKLPQMITSEALEGKQEGEEELPPISPLSKILVALAGPFMNVVFAFVIASVIYFVGLPVLVNPSFIGPVDPASEEGVLGISEGDEIVAINGTPVNSWQEISVEVVTSTTNVLNVSIARGGVAEVYQLNTHTREGENLKWLDLPPRQAPVVGIIESGKPAEAAGFKEGDRFISFSGVPVYSQERLIELVNDSNGMESEAVIVRDGAEMVLKVTPFYDAENKRGRIGIGFSVGIYRVQQPGPSPIAQVDRVMAMMGKTFSALYHSEKTGIGAKDLAGPVGILGMLANQVMIDYRLALSFMVLLNINLAILNLLPIPVLDGGHIMMSLYEAIFRRPVSIKFQEYATGIFAVLLIGFMLYVTVFGDLSSKRRDMMKSMFKHGSQAEVIESSNPTPAQP